MSYVENSFTITRSRFLYNHQISSRRVSNFKIKIKEINEEIKLLNEYENAILVFDEFLGTSRGK